MLQFTVEIRYAKGPPIVLAKFSKDADARSFIALKIQDDIRLKTKVTYVLLDMGEEIESFDSDSASSGDRAAAMAGTGSGQGQSSGQNFRPNPLQTSPRPPGVPPSSFKSDDDKDKK